MRRLLVGEFDAAVRAQCATAGQVDRIVARHRVARNAAEVRAQQAGRLWKRCFRDTRKRLIHRSLACTRCSPRTTRRGRNDEAVGIVDVLRQATGRRLIAPRAPGSVYRGLGQLTDGIGRVIPFDSVYTAEGMELLTLAKDTDDPPSITTWASPTVTRGRPSPPRSRASTQPAC